MVQVGLVVIVEVDTRDRPLLRDHGFDLRTFEHGYGRPRHFAAGWGDGCYREPGLPECNHGCANGDACAGD